jgi:hypothetical protein
MKKLMLLSALILMSLQIVCAQSKNFKPKDKYVDINAGIGLFPTFLKDAGKAKLLPLAISADYKLAKNFSLGLYAGHSVTETGLRSLSDGSQAQWRNSYYITGLRMAAHSSYLNGWNIYGGMTIGYSHSNIEMMEGDQTLLKTNRGIEPNSGNMIISGFMGARYSFTEKVGFFTEVGMGSISLATAGLSIRL